MAENPTHLETHTGKTKKLRYQTTPPTDPTPVSGDIFLDNSVGATNLSIKTESTWISINLTV